MSIPQPATPEDDNAYYRAILHDLINRGADLARQIHESAAATPQTDPTIAFDRISRAIRRTIALVQHIANRPAPKPARTATRQKLIRDVEDAIHRRRRETDAAALYAELNERLDDPELEIDIQGRPIEDIVEEICRDLGVAVQARSWVWKRRTPEEVAALRSKAAAQPNHPPKPPPTPPHPS